MELLRILNLMYEKRSLDANVGRVLEEELLSTDAFNLQKIWVFLCQTAVIMFWAYFFRVEFNLKTQ